MDVLSFVTHLIIFIITFVVYKKFSNPFVFFNLIWSALIGISIIGTSGIDKPSDDIYLIFLIGGVSFNIFGVIFILLDEVFHPVKKEYIKRILIKDKWKKVTLSVLNVIILIYYVLKGLELLEALNSGTSYENIRGYYYSDDYFANTAEYLLVTYLFDPIIVVSEIVFSINMLDRSYKKSILVVMLMNILLRAVISGGRMIIFEFGIIVIICFILNRKASKYNKKSTVQILTLVLFIVLIAGFISIGRSEDGNKSIIDATYNTLVSNFTGSFTYFSILKRYSMYSNASFVRVFFAGIIDMVSMILNFTGFTSIELVRNTIGNLLNKFYFIGDLSYNAMPTMYYYFYGSLGKVGVVLGTALLAYYCVFAYRHNKRYRTYKSFSFYLLMMLVIMESPMKWLPFDSSFIMSMFYIIIFVSNKKMEIKVPVEKKK